MSRILFPSHPKISLRPGFATPIFIAFLILLTRTPAVSAQESCAIASPQDILSCALNTHPAILAAFYQQTRDEKLVGVAAQRLNPEFEHSLQGGQIAHDSVLITDSTLSLYVPLAKKRAARIAEARATLEQSRTVLQSERESAALQIISSLFRLQQIKTEIERVDETTTTFAKIQRALRGRPQLTPEQSVSQTSFELAAEEYDLKKQNLIQEQTQLIQFLELATAHPYNEFSAYLPQLPKSWPSFSADPASSAAEYSAFKRARADQTLAQARINLAAAEAWPDLKIGPTIQSVSLSAPNNQLTGGVAFAIPLPILNRNQGQRALAEADRQLADQRLSLLQQTTARARSALLTRYQQALNTLKNSTDPRDLNARHRNIETLFARGLVSSPLVIEAHRQLYEITRIRNEQEQNALDALWRIYILDGTVFDQKL